MELLMILFAVNTNNFDLPPNLLASICYIESKYDVNAVHQDDGGTPSLGTCQIKLKTARWMGFKGTQQQLMDPINNVYYSAKYLNYQLNRYHDITKAVIAYNKGNALGLVSTPYSVKVLKYYERHKNDF